MNKQDSDRPDPDHSVTRRKFISTTAVGSAALLSAVVPTNFRRVTVWPRSRRFGVCLFIIVLRLCRFANEQPWAYCLATCAGKTPIRSVRIVGWMVFAMSTP